MFLLLKPSLRYLPAYQAALERGWSPDERRLVAAAREELEKIKINPCAFVEQLDEVTGHEGPISYPSEATVTLPDGSNAARLPGFRRWAWDGEFCGSIDFRWRPGTSDLPPHVLGHIGYSIVPWKRKRGYAKAALRMLLLQIKRYGLDHIEIMADPDNIASQKVILANGGILIGTFQPPSAYGPGEKFRFRITL